MARWDQMTVARRQRAAEEMDRDVAAEEMDQEGSGEITEAPIQAKKAEVARFTDTSKGGGSSKVFRDLAGPVAKIHRELSAGGRRRQAAA